MLGLIIFVIVILYNLPLSWRCPERTLAIPSIAAMLCLVWFIPQLVMAWFNSDEISIGYAVYCLAGAFFLASVRWGWKIAANAASLNTGEQHLQAVALPALVLFTALSISLNIQFLRAADAYRDVSQWSGGGTIVAFFSTIRYLAFALTALHFFHRRSWLAFLMMAGNGLIIVMIAFGEFRRTDLISLLVVLAGLFAFLRGRMPPLLITLASGLSAVVAVYAITDIRQVFGTALMDGESRLSLYTTGVLLNINFLESIADALKLSPDIQNGINIVSYAIETLDFRYGAELWNDMVWQYIPAQLVGDEVKTYFLIGERASIYNVISNYFGYFQLTGTTRTGIGSAFLDFSLLGGVFFGLMGWAMAKIFRRALSGDIISQAFYLALIPTVLVSFTHGYSFFFTQFPLLWAGQWAVRALSSEMVARSHLE